MDAGLRRGYLVVANQIGLLDAQHLRQLSDCGQRRVAKTSLGLRDVSPVASSEFRKTFLSHSLCKAYLAQPLSEHLVIVCTLHSTSVQ